MDQKENKVDEEVLHSGPWEFKSNFAKNYAPFPPKDLYQSKINERRAKDGMKAEIFKNSAQFPLR